MELRSDDNTWGFPGGSMELGESFEATAKENLRKRRDLLLMI